MQSTLQAATDLSALTAANQAYARRYPGDRPNRQPVHVVYGGAQLFKATTTQRLGQLGLRAMALYAPDAFTFARGIGMSGHETLGDAQALTDQTQIFEHDPSALQAVDPAAWLALTVYHRVLKKLEDEPVEDFRIDFEDGFGSRPDPEEDAAAIKAAQEAASALKQGILSPFFGIRIKALNDENLRRSVRTLDLFVTTLVQAVGTVPENFVVTLPKITSPAQVTALIRLFEVLEERLSLKKGALQLEIMIELTQSLMAPDGRSMLPALLDACEGRCVGAHFGTYDYTASYAITAAFQAMDHAACRAALDQMKLAYAGTGVFLSDGATNVMPVPVHRAKGETPLTTAQKAANQAAIHSAWRLGAGHIRGSLIQGIYQGWDLHPAQLPMRYGTCFAFFLEGFAAAAERLRNFVDKAAQATLVGDVFDDAATGQGLLNYFLRALNCGAVSLDDLAVTGLTVAEIQTRSFAKILALRTARHAQ